jgi:predicted amidohydrolase
MPDCRIAAAQISSVRGDIDHNICVHAAAMTTAAAHGVTLLVFPELSLTGYELDLAADLAMTPQDRRLQPLVNLSRQYNLAAVVGAPLQNGSKKPTLGAIVLSGQHPTGTYHKMHLGGDEPTFFAAGDEPLMLSISGHKVGIAICADASTPSHPQRYAALGADVYAASVFLTSEWYESDMPRLAAHAARYQMLTVMANHAGSQGTYESVGKSAVWRSDGALLLQSRNTESALLIARKTNGIWRGEIVGL